MKAILSWFVPLILVAGCQPAGKPSLAPSLESHRTASRISKQAPRNSVQVIHVFVALCDNVHQGIVPVAPSLGNGEDPKTNLYWGAAFGVKTFFGKRKDWVPVKSLSGLNNPVVLDRVIFKHVAQDVILIADAYRGREIKRAIQDFLDAAAGLPGESIEVQNDRKQLTLHLGGSAQLLAYIGHNGLMDFSLTSVAQKNDNEARAAIILACASKSYFAESLRQTGARPLVWTTNLMAPEAYVLASALDGWLRKESDEQIRKRAANAYNQYQNCGARSADRLFATGW